MGQTPESLEAMVLRSGGGHSRILGYRAFPPRFPQVLNYLEYSWAGAVSLGSDPPDWPPPTGSYSHFLLEQTAVTGYKMLTSLPSPRASSILTLDMPRLLTKAQGVGSPYRGLLLQLQRLPWGSAQTFPPGPFYFLPCWDLSTVSPVAGCPA